MSVNSEVLFSLWMCGFYIQGKRVGGSCNASAIAYKTVKKYRQYMNRRGGFNRPLDSIK